MLPGNAEPTSNKLTRSAVIVPVLVAVIGAAGVIIAAVVGNKGGFSAVLPGSPVQTTTITESFTATPNPTESPHSETPLAGIWHRGPLTMRSGSADLDAPATDPQWGVLSVESSAEYDLAAYPTSIGPLVKAQLVQMATGSDVPCAEATGYDNARVGANWAGRPLSVEQRICVRTGQGRFAELTITELGGDHISFDVTTYKGRDD